MKISAEKGLNNVYPIKALINLNNGTLVEENLNYRRKLLATALANKKIVG